MHNTFFLSKTKLPTHMYTRKNRKTYQMKIPCIYRFQNVICLLIVSVCACVCGCFYFRWYLRTNTFIFFFLLLIFVQLYCSKMNLCMKKQSFPKSTELIAGMLLSHGNRSCYTLCEMGAHQYFSKWVLVSDIGTSVSVWYACKCVFVCLSAYIHALRICFTTWEILNKTTKTEIRWASNPWMRR